MMMVTVRSIGCAILTDATSDLSDSAGFAAGFATAGGLCVLSILAFLLLFPSSPSR